MQKNVFKENSAVLFFVKKLLSNFVLGLVLTFVISICCGYQYKLIGSGSMLPTLSLKSLVIVAPVKNYEKDLKVGDIITFKASADSTSGITFTHRIVDIDEKTGWYITKGDNRDTQDANPVNPDRLVGKVVANFNFVGYAITYIKANLFMFTFCLIIFLLAFMIIV